MKVLVPSSKSVTQRALLAAALAEGQSEIRDALWCDDSEALTRGLRQMGVAIEWDGTTVTVRGRRALSAPSDPLTLGNAGTAVRFLTGAALVTDGAVTIDGVEAMRRRPMPGLLDALAALGLSWSCSGRPACPPVTLYPAKGPIRHSVALDPAGSSQQVSALLLAAPNLDEGLEIRLTSHLPSRPYVDLTVEVMEAFSAEVKTSDSTRLVVHPSPYRPSSYRVEGDHSSASYVLAASWLTGTDVEIPNLNPDSKQPDRVFARLLQRLDEEGDLTLNLNDSPDIAPTMAVCALFRKAETIISGIGHLRIKETDRLTILASQLERIGAKIHVREDGWRIEPATLAGPANLDPHQDHRMAMCFGLLSLRVRRITITDRPCVSKSYPEFWTMLDRFGPR
ncbi:MAG: 3-phosphoshikimate 1-carboxyvinyltransferase [Deltaproteobacteria bacterium]|nr:3-phosphoshikimate 1-carboxyvinyltransferase [Deltaproteobacteria bacterium]